MPQKARYKTKGGKKDSASKGSMNQSIPGTQDVAEKHGTAGTEEQDPKRRFGQFGGAGEPPIMKR